MGDRPTNPALAKLFASLDATEAHTSATLAEALSGPISYEDLAPWIQFDPNNYRRNLVARGAGYEVRVLCWLPNQRTSLHGHDKSACAFRILRGTSTEIRLRQPDRQWWPGTVVREEGERLVHQVTNLGDEPLVSLHAYAPVLPVDQPPARYEGKRIVVIGGGVSGAALAIHLLDKLGAGLQIAIVERRQWLGRGPAYGTSDPGLRLNVPAERMSLFPERALDFVAWASGQGAMVPSTALLPRQLFGEYVEDRLASAIRQSAGKVWVHRAEAVSASPDGVLLADGTMLRAAAVVLATGNQLPAAPSAIGRDLLRSNRVIADPWNAPALQTIGRDESVLVIGTGLTATDVLMSLKNQGHRGRVVAVSRRGLLPRPHLAPDDPRKQAVTIDLAVLPRRVAELSRWLRREAARLEEEGIGWQCLIDALRPVTSEVWRSLPSTEQTVFMRRLRPYWEVLRHRSSADALAVIDAWRARGTLSIEAGTIGSARDADDGVTVTILPDGRPRRFDRIVLCTGPETDIRRWTSPLFRQLIGDGHLQADPLGIGALTDDDGRAIGPRGAVPWLFALGNLRRPHLWETTSVPDIVRQAAAMVSPLAAIVGLSRR